MGLDIRIHHVSPQGHRLAEASAKSCHLSGTRVDRAWWRWLQGHHHVQRVARPLLQPRDRSAVVPAPGRIWRRIFDQQIAVATVQGLVGPRTEDPAHALSPEIAVARCRWQYRRDRRPVGRVWLMDEPTTRHRIRSLKPGRGGMGCDAAAGYVACPQQFR